MNLTRPKLTVAVDGTLIPTKANHIETAADTLSHIFVHMSPPYISYL